MQPNNIVEVDGLTATENKVYNLNGVGKQIKEIAAIMNSSYETAKSHMKNIKHKLGLQKDKEITAHFWCMLVGKNFDEVKKLIISSFLLLVFVLYLPFDRPEIRENRMYNNRARRTIVAKRNDYSA